MAVFNLASVYFNDQIKQIYITYFLMMFIEYNRFKKIHEH